jgi:hypothetical protein
VVLLVLVLLLVVLLVVLLVLVLLLVVLLVVLLVLVLLLVVLLVVLLVLVLLLVVLLVVLLAVLLVVMELDNFIVAELNFLVVELDRLVLLVDVFLVDVDVFLVDVDDFLVEVEVLLVLLVFFEVVFRVVVVDVFLLGLLVMARACKSARCSSRIRPAEPGFSLVPKRIFGSVGMACTAQNVRRPMASNLMLIAQVLKGVWLVRKLGRV